MNKLRLGFVGCGYMGQLAHLENYARLPNVELVALAEGRPALAHEVAQRFGFGKVYADHRELLANADVDAVVAIMHYGLHYGVVPDLLDAGKHVATEKSLCITTAAAQKLVEIAEAKGVVYQVSYMKRFDPGVRLAVERVRQMQQSKEFGELVSARVWCCAGGDWQWHSPDPIKTSEAPPGYDVAAEAKPDWMTDDDFAWLSSWLNYYSHQTNLLRYMLGEDYELEHFDFSDRGAFGLVKTPSGVRGALEFPAYRASGWDEGIEIFFNTAVVRVKVPAPLARQSCAQVTIELGGDEPQVLRPYAPPVWAMAEQAKAFVAAVQEGAPTLSPVTEAAKEVAFVESVLRWRKERGQ